MNRILAFIVLLVFAAEASSQQLQDSLRQSGFENVLLNTADDSELLIFENRIFRNSGFSLIQAMNLKTSEEKFNYFPLYHNNLVAGYSEDFQILEVDQELQNFYQEANKPFKNYRWQIRIQPRLATRFGFYTDPFQTKFNIILDTRIYFARGLSLQTGLSIPVNNNFDNQGMKLRAAPTMLHYFNQPWNDHFIAASLGSFYNDRYGLDLEYRYADLRSNWSFGLGAGLTGFYWLNGFEKYSTPMNELYLVADTEWRTGIQNTSLKLSAGQFLYEDKGVRLDLIKQFAQAEIGLYASRTDIGTTGGFQFAFSLFPGSILRGNKMELRTTEEYRYEYTYNNEQPVAASYRIGMPRLSNVLRNYHQDWVRFLGELR